MKKLVLLTSMLSLFSLWQISAASASSFTDVSTTSPYTTYINDLQRLGITDGVSPGLFGPTQTVTRAQFAKFVAVAYQLTDNGSSVPFQDMQGHWADTYVRAAYQAGIIDGTSATTFSPEQPVKREEAAAMIWRIAQSKGITSTDTHKFNGAPDIWAVAAVNGVLSKGWYDADVVKTGDFWGYRPRDTMTRQEMAALLDQSMQDVPGSVWVAGAVEDTPSTTQAQEAAEAALPSWEESLKSHLLNQETSFQINIDDMDEYNQIKGFINDFLADNDYLHYISHSMSYKYDGISTVTFTVEYLETKAQTDYVTAQAKAIVASITNAGMNVYEKEKAIHDYVISHLTYDQTLVEHSAYAGLTKGTTVCQGYALLTYRLLTEAGIENKIVEGKANGEEHTWNLVHLDGNWYHLDTTWDDPVPDVVGRLTYDYYNFTDAQMKQVHTWTSSDYPAATQDFIQELGNEVKSGTVSAASAQTLLSSTGLDQVTVEHKADTLATVQTLLQQGLSARQTQISFYFKSSLGSAQTVMNKSLTNTLIATNKVVKAVYEYGTETRLPGYTTVNVTVSY